ncbi:MAG: AAA family ATPase, partial [Mycobacterium sp.]|nr:AAA family ATPase [Mycobacterium sp.]
APMLAGYTPVGVGIDETMGLIDFELKRLGYVTPMPMGVDIPRRAVTAGRSAVDVAVATMHAFTELGVADTGSSAFDEPDSAEVAGLLVSRDQQTPTPKADHLPALSALLRVSRDVGELLLGGARADDVHARSAPETGWEEGARQSVADQLSAAASRVMLTDDVLTRVREVEKLLGAEIVSEAMLLERHDIGAILVPGTRICFTGTAQDAAGRIVERDEIERLARSAGLTPVRTVSKTRCDVLVTAEAGTQSGKARKAAEYGKPVLCADEFFAWLAAGPAEQHSGS